MPLPERADARARRAPFAEMLGQIRLAASRRRAWRGAADAPISLDPCTRRAWCRASTRGLKRLACEPSSRTMRLRVSAPCRLPHSGHHRIPDIACITVMRRSAMRSRPSPSCTVLAVYLAVVGVAVKDEHTDGGTWRGASHPQDSTAPPRLPYGDRASLRRYRRRLSSRQIQPHLPTGAIGDNRIWRWAG
jgi:hypothetical protein